MEKKYKYIIDLLLQAQGFSNNMTKVQNQVRGLETVAKRTRGVLLQMAGALGFTYGIGQVTQLIQETIKLAAKAEGVKAAFDKLDNPGLLKDLQKATRGTVSDLDLMSKTVQARNFKISMEALPTYFQFATQRALETGQAVDYLVESLVVGVGRKSVLWLDNLGLSTVQINEELKKTPNFAEAVGKVIEKEMEAAGTVADTTATKIQSITASWENLKLALGESILSKGGAGMMGVLTDWVDMLSAPELKGGQKVLNWVDTLIGGDKTQQWKENKEAAEKYFATLDKANTMRYVLTYAKRTDDEGKYLLQLAAARYKDIKAQELADQTKQKEERTIESINTDIQMYNELILKTPVANKETIKSHLEKIKVLEDEKKALLSLADVTQKVSAPKKASVPAIPGFGKGAAPSSVAGALGVDPDKLAAGPKMSGGLDTVAEAARKADVELYKFMDSVNWFNNLEDPFTFLKDSLEAITDTLMEGGDSWEEYAGNVLNSSKRIIGALLAESIATSISTALKANAAFLVMLGPLAPLAIAGISSLAAGLARTAFNSLIPKFAKGVLAYGPTIGMIGEYPGASTNPEVTAPLDKLTKYIQPAMTEGTVTFRIGDRELIGILERSHRVNRSIRGR